MTAADALVSSISSSRCSSSFEGELTRVEIGQIVMSSEWEGLQQIARIGLISEPTVVSCRSKHRWHAVVNRADEFVGRRRQYRESTHPFSVRVLPVFPNAGDAEWRAVLQRDRVGLPVRQFRRAWIASPDTEGARCRSFRPQRAV